MNELTPTKISPFLGPLDENDAQWFLGCQVWQRATSAHTDGALGLIEQLVPPGFGSPYHLHHNEDEAFYVLEGEVELTVEGEVSTAGPGTFVNLPRGTTHTFKNAGDRPARFLALITPGGLEGFFEEIGEPTTGPSSPPAGPPDVEKVLATAPRYGVEILPPPGG